MESMLGVIYSYVNQATLTGGTFAALVTALVGIFNYPEIDPTLRVTDIPINGITIEYDFIIVGAGSAGCVVANRLSEISEWQILLLEAGGDETAYSDVPVGTYQLWNTFLDWNYTTVPQANACRVIENTTCIWPRGRAIGGSSVVNDFAAIRGNRLDYDLWAGLGNTGWSYDEVLPFFIRAENQRYPPYAADRTYHGVGGYLSIQRSNYRSKMAEAWVKGGEQLGYQEVDANAAQQTGFMIAEGTLTNGTRCSTGKCYLRPARQRSNLHVSMNSLVDKILISENGIATSVLFQRDGRTLKVSAKKEIILSAGTINSPQILLRSGIGPRSELAKLNIPVIRDLPVGRNLQDHIGVPLLFKVDPGIVITPSLIYTVNSALDYAKFQMGPLTSPVGVESLAFMLRPNTTTPDLPDTETVFSSYLPNNPGNVPLWLGISFGLHPVSRGTITISSTDPTQPPLIDPRYLTDERDVQATILAMKNTLAVANTPALKAINSTFFHQGFSACSNFQLYSDAYFRCLVTNYSTTIYHPVGTCSMGPEQDPNSVVDPRLRLYDLQGLRIIDGSVFPVITSGNVNIPIIMIAERASDLIRQDYNVSRTVLVTGGQ